MSATNHALVGDALSSLAQGAEPFVARVVSRFVPAGKHWTTILAEKDAHAGLRNASYLPGDLTPLLRAMTERFGQHGYLFTDEMPAIGGTYANELRATRNAWAHFQPFDDADTFRALDTVERLLRVMGSVERADRIAVVRALPLERMAAKAEISTDGADAASARSASIPLDLDEPAYLAQVPIDVTSARIEDQDEESEADDAAAALREILGALDRPLPLATVSQQLVARFGREVSDDWAGAGTFVAFVQRTEPRAAMSGPQPGYVHPVGHPVPEGWGREPQPTDVPEAIRDLRAADPELPLVTWSRMRDTISAALTTGPLDGPTLQALTRGEIDRRAREAIANAALDGRLIYRAHLAWVLGVLRAEHHTPDAVTVASATQSVAAHMAGLAAAAGVGAERLRADIKTWLEAGDGA